MGLPGRLSATLQGDLADYCHDDSMALYMVHYGWVVVKSAENADIVATATFKSPRGEKEGPISVLVKKGDGLILFTSYYSTVYSDFRRFNIFRVMSPHLLKPLESIADRYEQDITGRITDAVLRGETHRAYKINLFKGENTLYFYSEKDYFQIDLYDSSIALIESRDFCKKLTSFTLESKSDNISYVKIFPYSSKRNIGYSFVSANGSRIFPYFSKVIIFGSVFLVLIVIFIIWKLFFNKKYSGILIRR